MWWPITGKRHFEDFLSGKAIDLKQDINAHNAQSWKPLRMEIYQKTSKGSQTSSLITLKFEGLESSSKSQMIAFDL